jgi:hypothetical protein
MDKILAFPVQIGLEVYEQRPSLKVMASPKTSFLSGRLKVNDERQLPLVMSKT